MAQIENLRVNTYSTLLLAIRRAQTMLRARAFYYWEGRRKTIRVDVDGCACCPIELVLKERPEALIPLTLTRAFMLAADNHPQADPELRRLIEVVMGLKVVTEEEKQEVTHFLTNATGAMPAAVAAQTPQKELAAVA